MSNDDGPMKDPDTDEGVFVLDLEDEDDVDEVTREAVEAVERAGELSEELDEPQPGSDHETTIEELERELAELRDRSIQTLADFDNFRKRAQREREETQKYGLADFMRDFLPILDNLQRALESPGTVEDLKLGVEMIERQIQDLLRQRGVTPVEAEGQVFDPAVHEAMTRVEDPDLEEPRVQEVMQPGYALHGRLLRPALVSVAMPEDEAVPSDSGEPDGGDGDLSSEEGR